MSRALAAAVCAALVLAALGCGEGGATRFAAGDRPRAGGGGELTYLLDADPGPLDPLLSRSAAALAVARPTFEPLVAREHPPYGEGRPRPGLALDWRHSGDFRVWAFRLRRAVRFQDGTPLNARAVVANATRWRSLAAGRDAFPELLLADAPRPHLVRFVLSVPVRDLARRLRDPRLGIVSPERLRPESGEEATLTDPSLAGSGPFALGRDASRVVELVRHRGWWGTGVGLGPALDGIRFRVVEDLERRMELLADGEALVAGGLTSVTSEIVEADPLLTVVRRGGPPFLGLERSVRGLAGSAPRSLAGVWLTHVGLG